jgi:hypothetical protein
VRAEYRVWIVVLTGDQPVDLSGGDH